MHVSLDNMTKYMEYIFRISEHGLSFFFFSQAKAALDSLSKALFFQLFEYLVEVVYELNMYLEYISYDFERAHDHVIVT